jgi:hypothetical protein
MCKYFPHKEGKKSTLHNIQEATGVGDMGKNIPRMYASLEDRQEENQCHVIKVEGKSINHTFSILNYLG